MKPDPAMTAGPQAGIRSVGWSMRVPPGSEIRQFQVFGERSSGTNFVGRLLGRNTPLTPTDALGWKHGFPAMTAIPADTLIVGVVRRADDWALSMHAKPWHCPPEMQALEFSDFLRAEWATVVDRPRYFPAAADLPLKGRPLQPDRDPLTGRCFANLFALRRAKLRGLLSFHARGCAFVLVRLEAAIAAPESFLSELRAALDLPPRERPLRPVVRRLGARFKPALDSRPRTPPALSAQDRDFLRAQSDLGLEASLGYTY